MTNKDCATTTATLQGQDGFVFWSGTTLVKEQAKREISNYVSQEVSKVGIPIIFRVDYMSQNDFPSYYVAITLPISLVDHSPFENSS